MNFQRLAAVSFVVLLATAFASCRRAEPPLEPLAIDPLPGQLIADPENPRWLSRFGEGSFFMCGPGDPEGFLYRGERLPDGTRDGDQVQLIEKLAKTGANSIYLMAVRSHGGDGKKTHNPFTESDPKAGLSDAILDQWESWFRLMDEHDIVIYFFFYDDSARVWDTGDSVAPEEEAFVSTLVDRFRHHRNLIWVLAEEYEERFSARKMKRLAEYIRRRDPHGHPIAVHKLDGLGFREFSDDPWIDQFAIQYNKETADELHRGVLKAWRAARGRYNLNLAEAIDWGTGREARTKMWATAMAGAYVMVLDMDIASTPVGDLEACGYLVGFFESTDFQTMEPQDELAAGDTKYVLANPGTSYVLYAEPGTKPLGLNVPLDGAFDLLWLNPRSGDVVEETDARQSGQENFERSRPPGFSGDVALYLLRS